MEIPSPSAPTAIKATFDTSTLPERSLQSKTRPSNSNLHATLQKFLSRYPHIDLYYDKPSRILALLINKRIIQNTREGKKAGIGISEKTARRVEKREIRAEKVERKREEKRIQEDKREGRHLDISRQELSEIERIIGEKIRGRYLGVERIESDVREGEILIRVKTYEPEEEYEW